VLLLANGSKYEGDWSNDFMNGIGKLFYDNGSLAYEGGFFDNKVDGLGVMYNDQPRIPNYNTKTDKVVEGNI
jgi:antitoxin component YwqK of YwqJK toxin-antitoxin module